MALRHLNDTEIQDYLDGVISRENHWTAIHLENCEYCKEQLNQYQSLYIGLKQEVNYRLSSNFATSVVAKIQGRSVRFMNIKLLTILISIVTLLIGSGVTFYFTGLKPIFALWNQISIIIKNLNLEWVSTITDFITGLNLNLSLLGFAILIVIIISTIDRFIIRSKKKLASLFR